MYDGTFEDGCVIHACTRMDVLREKLLHNCQISKLSILQNPKLSWY